MMCPLSGMFVIVTMIFLCQRNEQSAQHRKDERLQESYQQFEETHEQRERHRHQRTA